MYAFLSDEWIEAAREIRERHAADLPEIAMSIRLNQVVTGAPFTDDDIHSYIDTSSGQLELDLGELDEPDAVITTDYEVARGLIMGADPQAMMQAFLEGRIKVQGDMTRLIALQATASMQDDNEAAAQVAAEIQAITE